MVSVGKICLCWGLTSQSTIFQSCRDGATDSWVINQYFRGVKCLAQGHNTAAVGFEPPTSRSGVRHSSTEPPRSPLSERSRSFCSKYLLMIGNKGKTHKMLAKESIYLLEIKFKVLWDLARAESMEHYLTRLQVPMLLKRQEDYQWKGSNARIHRLGHLLLSRRIFSVALALLSNTKRLQHFHLW